MNTIAITETEAPKSLFGPVINCYTRAQAIADGVLVDVSETLQPCPFKYPVALSQAAYEATIATGGEWVPIENPTVEDQQAGCIEELRLPGGQDVKGRLHDVFTMLLCTMKNPRLDPLQRQNTDSSRIYFSVLVDQHGTGRRARVELYAVCGPGDTAAPVITIMIRGED